MKNSRRERVRLELLKRSREQLEEIEQIFRDVAYWNKNRPKNYIDPDPDGELMRWKAEITEDIKMLEADGRKSC